MRRLIIVHPLLLAVFPVLFLFSRNMGQFELGVMARPAATWALCAAAGWAGLAGALALWGRMRGRGARWLVSARKGALIVSLFALLYFSYGHVVSMVADLGFGPADPESVGIFILAFAFLAAVAAVLRSAGDLARLTSVANFASAVLVGISVWNIASFQLSDAARANRTAVARLRMPPLPDSNPSNLPSIYCIVLDGYGRADNLRDIYGYDNSEFISWLESRGFYVPAKARANYSHTLLAMASLLNYEYLDGLKSDGGDFSKVAKPAVDKIFGSKARRFLRERGYRLAALRSGYQCTDIENADIRLSPKGEKNEFTRGLEGLTPAKTQAALSGADRTRVLYALDELPKLATRPYPLFVFAHIVAPHPPFSFGPEGEPVQLRKYFGMLSANHLINKSGMTRREYMGHYVDQMRFVNKRVKAAIDAILADSSVPPVIILTGDHGPGAFLQHESLDGTYLQDRMSIMSAYHIPGGAEGLREDMTPVNAFRVVFNRLFGAGLPLLPDKSFFSCVTKPYVFTDVTAMIGDAADRARYEVLTSADYFPEDGVGERMVANEDERTAGKVRRASPAD